MAQGFVGMNIFDGSLRFGDSANLDPFSRLRVSNPVGQLDAQFTYDLQPLIFQTTELESGATITHDTTNRMALFTFSSTPADGAVIMQSYEWFRYQAGRGQLPMITFNFNGGVANCIKFAEYGNGTNAYGFRLNGTTPEFYILSGTDNGNHVVVQDDWVLDKMDGSGASGEVLDVTKCQILIIDFQALYVGRVRMGFDIDGQIVYCHEFNFSNNATHPYVQTASLPIRVGMTCSDTVSTTMWFTCATVLSEGVQEDVSGFSFSQEVSLTAASGARTHAISLRPRATFNSIQNRPKFILESVDVLVTGNNPIKWELTFGQALSGASYADVNNSYSGFEYDITGTLSGDPDIIAYTGYAAASNQAKTSISTRLFNKYPVTLDAAGSPRIEGTITLNVTGIGGTSGCHVALNWKEVR